MADTVAISKYLHEAGHVAAYVLLAELSEEPEELLSRTSSTPYIVIRGGEGCGSTLLSEDPELVTNRERMETALQGQPRSIKPLGMRDTLLHTGYGHEAPMAGAFMGLPLLIVGQEALRDPRRMMVISRAQTAGVMVMAIGNGHVGMAALPNMWLSTLPSAELTDSTCIRDPRVMAFVHADAEEEDLYDAIIGEHVTKAAHECPNVFTYYPDDTAIEDYLKDDYTPSDFGTQSEELQAVTLAVWLGFRNIATIGLAEEVYDGMWHRMRDTAAQSGTWINSLDGNLHDAGRLAKPDYCVWLDYYTMTHPGMEGIHREYLVKPKAGGRALKHLHLLEAYDRLVAVDARFGSLLVKGEVKAARTLLEMGSDCRDCDMRKALPLLMDRFHKLFTDDPKTFSPHWAEIFPEHNHYNIGGKRYARS